MRRAAAHSALLTLALLAGGWLLYATPRGLGLEGDSASYVAAARHVVGLWNASPAAPTDLGPLASAQWPPGYPAALGMGAIVAGRDVLTVARLLHALLLAMLVWEVGRAAWGHTRTAALGVAAAGLVATSPAAHLTYGLLLSEALFVTLVCVWRLRDEAYGWPRRGRVRRSAAAWLAGATMIFAVASLVRWAGLFLVAAIAVAFAAASLARRQPTRLAGAAAFAVAAVVPAALWAGLAVTQEARVVAWHPPGTDELWRALDALGSWVAAPAPEALRVAAGTAVVALLLWTCWRHLKRPRRADRGAGLWAAMLLGYAAGLIAARSLVDAAMPLGERFWLPLLPLAVLLAADAARRSWRRRALRPAVLGGVAALLVMNLLAVWPVTAALREGIGYASPAWRASPTLAYVAALPPEVPLMTDAADAVELLLGRDAEPLPATTFRTAGRVNTNWRRQLRDAARRVRDAGGVIAFFDAVDRGDYLVTPEQAATYVDLHLVADLPDGRVYRIGGVR